MRVAALLLAALAVPLPLLAQYPEPGTYSAGATPAGSTQIIPLKLLVEKKGDSTVVHLWQPDDKGENELPLVERGMIRVLAVRLPSTVPVGGSETAGQTTINDAEDDLEPGGVGALINQR